MSAPVQSGSRAPSAPLVLPVPPTPTLSPAGPLTSGSAGRVVVGDGTTGAGRARGRWRRWRWPMALAALITLVAIAAALPQPVTSTVPLAPDNPGDAGARALAQILQREGVDITYVRTSGEATRSAVAGTTLLVTGSSLLGDDQVAALAGTGADLVLLDPDPFLLGAVTEAADVADVAPESAATVRPAECADPDARAAGSILAAGAGYVAASSAATVCFPAAGGGPGAYLAVDGPRRVVALGDKSVLTNAALDEEGNAALALRVLGRNATLTWYVPSSTDFGQEAAGPGPAQLLPPWTGAIGLELLLVAVVAGLWRGRRLGRLVTEPLPVTVRAAETTRGRGRLYRRSRVYGHAAAALRAGTASRAAARLGLPRTAGAPAVIDALARAVGRPADEVAGLLYGPPPTDDAGLELLARRLDDLESEVHQL